MCPAQCTTCNVTISNFQHPLFKYCLTLLPIDSLIHTKLVLVLGIITRTFKVSITILVKKYQHYSLIYIHSFSFSFSFSLLLSFALKVSSESHCGTESTHGCHDKSKALKLNLIAIAIILFTSMIGVCLPLLNTIHTSS